MIWNHPPSTLDLPDGTVHIWKANLGDFSSRLQTFYALLNSEERQRADRYRFEQPRKRFIVTRAILRQLIGIYLDIPPDQIVLDTNSWGKPKLGDDVVKNLEFNVAHSEKMALIAFTRHSAVGIDVECVHPIDALEHLVTQFFSENERQTFSRIPKALQDQAFYKGWTRKEAYIKGRGKGLSIPLRAFDVTMAPGEAAALIADRTDADAVREWKLLDIEPGNGYAAALAVKTCQKAFDVVGYTLNYDLL